jgi:hypothetical protein
MRSLPEAATAALSQWNACSAPVLQSLRNLHAPTRQEIVLLFNEEDTTNLFAAVIPALLPFEIYVLLYSLSLALFLISLLKPSLHTPISPALFGCSRPGVLPPEGTLMA